MKANELRIGNYVEYNGIIETCYSIRQSGVDFNRGKTNKGNITQSYVWDAIQPIPITEQWLIDFGFEKRERFYNIPIKNKGILWVYLEREFCELGTRCGYSFAEIDCKHIHQLQNLHFALTGTELSKK